MAARLKQEGHSYKEVKQMTRVSKSTLQRYLRKKKYNASF